jgi:hypothetical protein
MYLDKKILISKSLNLLHLSTSHYFSFKREIYTYKKLIKLVSDIHLSKWVPSIHYFCCTFVVSIFAYKYKQNEGWIGIRWLEEQTIWEFLLASSMVH